MLHAECNAIYFVHAWTPFIDASVQWSLMHMCIHVAKYVFKLYYTPFQDFELMLLYSKNLYLATFETQHNNRLNSGELFSNGKSTIVT